VRELTIERDLLQKSLDSVERSVAPLRVELLTAQVRTTPTSSSSSISTSTSSSSSSRSSSSSSSSNTTATSNNNNNDKYKTRRDADGSLEGSVERLVAPLKVPCSCYERGMDKLTLLRYSSEI